jgi:hypothetical protein
MLSERRAHALAVLAANEEDLAAFIRHGDLIHTASAARDSAITDAAIVRDRTLKKALGEYSSSTHAARQNQLATALDAAHHAFKFSVLQAVAEAEASTSQARRDQGALLKQIRERGGFKTGELAAMVGLSTAEVSKLIRSGEDDITGVGESHGRGLEASDEGVVTAGAPASSDSSPGDSHDDVALERGPQPDTFASS